MEKPGYIGSSLVICLQLKFFMTPRHWKRSKPHSACLILCRICTTDNQQRSYSKFCLTEHSAMGIAPADRYRRRRKHQDKRGSGDDHGNLCRAHKGPRTLFRRRQKKTAKKREDCELRTSMMPEASDGIRVGRHHVFGGGNFIHIRGSALQGGLMQIKITSINHVAGKYMPSYHS